jgi:hypothetical protein
VLPPGAEEAEKAVHQLAAHRERTARSCPLRRLEKGFLVQRILADFGKAELGRTSAALLLKLADSLPGAIGVWGVAISQTHPESAARPLQVHVW